MKQKEKPKRAAKRGRDLSLTEHVRLGRLLAPLVRTLATLHARVQNDYVPNASVTVLVKEAERTVGALRAELEEVMFASEVASHLSDLDAIAIYYGREETPEAEVEPEGSMGTLPIDEDPFNEK